MEVHTLGGTFYYARVTLFMLWGNILLCQGNIIHAIIRLFLDMFVVQVCTILKDPKVRLHEIEVSLFSPFRPMLGQRGEPKSVSGINFMSHCLALESFSFKIDV